MLVDNRAELHLTSLQLMKLQLFSFFFFNFLHFGIYLMLAILRYNSYC